MGSLWNKVADTFNRTRNGTVPKAPSDEKTTRFLREDGTWAEPTGGGGSSDLPLEVVNGLLCIIYEEGNT